MVEIVFKILDAVLLAFFNRRRLRVRVHRAFLGTGEECFFVNLTNRSSKRDLEVTHVWFQTDREIHVLEPQRRLPVRLKPDESWETWLPVEALPQAFRSVALTLVRARLSSGAVVMSDPNRNVPTYGSVAGSNRGS
jgi:hypothetical protein